MSIPAPSAPETVTSTAASTAAKSHAAGVAPTAAFAGIRRVPLPVNESNKTYAPGTPERAELKARLQQMAGEKVDIPLIIGGKEVRTGRTNKSVMPHDHGHVLGEYHLAGPEHVEQAIAAAAEARREWASWPWEDRAAVLLRAAELLATSWRATLNAATMLGQSKTAFQAEIDAASELVDFWRFNPYYAQELYSEQPLSNHTMWNQLEYRPLEGFVYAITPFNFTSIGGNLPTAPALMGNAVIWKPASSAMLSAYYIMRLLEAAGMPPGVINFMPGTASQISGILLDSRELAGVHFTGSTEVFNGMWKKIGENISRYRTYPRIVGETGGKDFIIAHPSADPMEVAVAMARGAFEYQGQKCSAASRVYVPASLWNDVRDRTIAMMKDMKMGDPRDFRNFVGAVIDKKAFVSISEYLEDAKKNAKILQGGKADDRTGYFIEPTLIQTDNPAYRCLCEEIFGPVLTAYVYPDQKWEETLHLVDATSPYALTGAVFAQERRAVLQALSVLRNAAGNFYINDKPTGAVVGQQPFGGA
ncbi:MAG TPA: L-glutamate gamma-semialdehyde dehydrogenase, partial [Vicinamibacterales bacterium]|nr:L-glutamate gamma-semialdehyde dehydrogenase [Vicinamibacterales bacterium]